MSAGTKNSLKRIKEILSGNIGYFSVTFFIYLVFVIAISLADSFFIHMPAYIPDTNLTIIVVALFLLTPTLSHGFAYVSAKSRGVEEVIQNSIQQKRSLFTALGVFWLSSGFLVINNLLFIDLNLAMILCSITFITSWWLICRIIIGYVKGI